MASRRRLILAGTAAFVVGLVALFPARVAYHWVSPPGLALAGIDGTVWRGRAANADIGGIYLRDLEWRFVPGRLLTATLAWHLEAVPSSGFIDVQAGIGFGGDVTLKDLRASVPLGALQSVVGVPGLQGTANANFPTARLSSDGIPADVTGSIEVGGLVLPLVTPGALGRYRAEFQTQDGTVVASVRDDDAVITIAGRLQVAPDRTYEFLGQVAPTAQTPQKVHDQMRFLGSPDAQGRYELRLSGRY